MGRVLMAFLAIVCVAATTQAAPTFVVDIGTPASEAGYNLQDWGPVQPTTSGGGWGGMGTATAPLSIDQLCRVVWEPTGNIWASVTFPKSIWYVDILHLDGIANDSFAVSVDSQPWGLYNDNSSTTEFWVMTRFSGQAGKTLQITSLANPAAPWWGHGTYGTLGIDRIEAYVPAPGAMLLGGLGTVLVGWLRRRRAM